MSQTLDILLEDQRKIEQRPAAKTVPTTRADRIIAEGDARRLSYRRINMGADAAMVYGAQIGYLHAQVRMLDAETEALNVVRDSALDYLTVSTGDIASELTVGFAYQPGCAARITSAHCYVTSGDPGDPAEDEELEISEVWVHGADITGLLSDAAHSQIHAAVLNKVHALQAKGGEWDGE